MKRKQSFQNNDSILYVISTPIGNLNEISNRVIEAINDSEVIFCEDTRVTGSLLNHLNIKKPLVSAYENIVHLGPQSHIDSQIHASNNGSSRTNIMQDIRLSPGIEHILTPICT